MDPRAAQKVLEKVATSDKATIVFEKQPDVKMRVTSGPWDGDKVILRDQVVEGRNVDGRLHIARKERHHYDWDPYVPPYYPYGLSVSVSADASDSFPA
jgi:hypothetical protein